MLIWTLPSPAWIQETFTDTTILRTVEMQVLSGSRVPLKWNYIKPTSWTPYQTQFSVNDDLIGILHHSSGQIEIFRRHDYRTRFNISESEVATLILNRVSLRENAIFRCRVLMLMRDDYSFKRVMASKIRVKVTGKGHE